MEDLVGRTLRELLTLARERLGPSAASLKTREELLSALSVPGVEKKVSEVSVPVVTSDFFRKRQP